MITGADLIPLAPSILVSLTAIAVMVAIAIRRSHFAAALICAIGLGLSLLAIWAVLPYVPRQVTPLIIVDSFGLYYSALIVGSTLAVVLLSYPYFARQPDPPEELYILLPTAAFGGVAIVLSSHFASFFLGLEVLSVALYGLIAYTTEREASVEAGLKYLVLAASSAAALVFGMGLVYARLGTMEFARMPALLTTRADFYDPMLLAGVALMITGIGFKLAVVPFHMWTPDVYEGAPAPVTAFVATVSKGALFGLLLRYFRELPGSGGSVFLVFTIIAAASMIAGNVLALLQNNVKRILAYSSIAHLGYLLVAFQAGGLLGARAATFYLTAYIVTTLGAFGVVAVLSDGSRDADRMEDYRGLFWRRPALGGVMALMLFSLAGIPLTAGFFGKFYVVTAGASSATWMLLLVLVVTSAVGIYYYLRVVVALFATDDLPADATVPVLRPVHPGSGIVLTALTGILFWLGVYPAPLIEVIQKLFVGLF